MCTPDVYLYTSNICTKESGVMTVENELLNAAAIAEEAGVPRSTVGKWISSKRLVAVQETQRGNRVSRLFRREDAQPLIDKAIARRASGSGAIGGATS